MFTRPIQYTQLKSIDELTEFSLELPSIGTSNSMEWNENGGMMVFITKLGLRYLSPTRPETNDLMKKEGYWRNENLGVPLVRLAEDPDLFCKLEWLQRDARAEWWAYTYQVAKKIADEKEIKEVVITEPVKVREIVCEYGEYTSLVDKCLGNSTGNNVGTYIIINDKELIVCDEYGRTYLITVKRVINDIVNMLIKAGYTKTTEPWRYVHPERKHGDLKRKLLISAEDAVDVDEEKDVYD